MREPIVLRREVVVPAKAEDLWPHVSNTNRMNRALGLPVMSRGEKKENYAYRATASLYGLIPLAWTEHPFEWIQDRYYFSARDFEGGPLTRFAGRVELVPEGKSTRVKISSEFTPRNLLGEVIVKHLTGKKAIDDTASMVEEIGAQLARGEQDCFPNRRTKTSGDDAALAARGADLRRDSCDGKSVERLLAHLAHAHDDELAGMRPFDLADRWGLDRLETLKTFLHAVKAGLLDLSWHLLCPNCGGGPGLGALSELNGKAHCPACDVGYQVDLDESVELRFDVNPAVRPASGALYCVGSPAHSRFAVAQFSVPKEGREIEVDLTSQSYVLRDLCKKRRVLLRPRADGPSELAPAFDAEEATFKPGRVRLRLESRCASALARLEASDWRDKAAKARLVTSLQDFRDLFGAEVLAPGVEIAVRGIALLFTDLKGSTAMYERIGDATAYAIVRDHFEYLFDIVARRKGAVVKTIGDAVMACFSSTADAVAAALEMQERVEELNQRLAPRPPVVLKIGVHAGPVIAINAGGVLDYFGTTANVAARVQNESEGGDVVVSEPVVKDPASSKLLDSPGWECRPFEAQLKGLSERFRLRRMVRK